MEARDRVVKDWVSQIKIKKIALPRFQRFEAWGNNTITDFLTSVVRGLPTGAALILEVGNKPQFKYRYFAGTPESGENVKELLLDGQQRLTALWRSLIDNYEDKTILLDLETKEDEDISVIAQSRWTKKGQIYPLWVDNPKDCWGRKKIPFKILNPDEEKLYFEWAKKATANDLDKDVLLESIISLRSKIGTFNIPYLYLPPETKPDVAIDVFIKLNTSYVRLTAFDIIVAQVEEATDISLHHKVNELDTEVPQISSYIESSSFSLAVATLLQDKLPNQSGFFNLDLKKMINEWGDIIVGARELVLFLEEYKIFDNERLPTETILAPIAALFAKINTANPDIKGNLKVLLKKYLWRSFFTDRYDRSIPTRILQDFRAIRKVIDSGFKNENEIPIFDETKYPLPNIELLSAAGWPKNKDRLARAILLLSLMRGAKDFADRSEVNRVNIKTREYHHLYPDAYLKRKGFQEKDSFKAINCALITWKTNRAISDKEPLQYLLERANASSLGSDDIKFRLSTHLIDYDALNAGNYQKFIEERVKVLSETMEKLCKGKEVE